MGHYGGYECGEYFPCRNLYENYPRRDNTFAIILVLFILLVIIGATFQRKC